MTLIVGLGNPGEQYEHTRHNVGWWAVDVVAEDGDAAWKKDKAANAEIAKHRDLILAKPQTFMNNSGSTVRELKKRTEGMLLVIHDDIDLPLGTIRVSSGASAGGHNGVQSIIDHLGTKDFWRIRIGVAPDREGWKQKTDPAAYVLKPFTKSEQKILATASDQLIALIEQTIERPKVQTVKLSGK